MKLSINPDIEHAETLPAAFYRQKENFASHTDRLFSAAWVLAGDLNLFQNGYNVIPVNLLPEVINEPLLLTRNDQDEVLCVSNVCTHRGNLLVDKQGKHKKLLCGYHGRRFGLDGTFEYMPEFDSTAGFPRGCDDLARIPLQRWRQFFFVGLDARVDFDSIVQALEERVGFLPIENFVPGETKTYEVNAHWALYCDNYLEGFHIPYVHPGLNKLVDYSQYKTVLYDYCNLQIGYGKDDTLTFDLPPGHKDEGKQIAAYYYWIFPNLMLNFYPWGLSLNFVEPISHNKSRVHFVSYVYDETKKGGSAGDGLNQVEMEDEAVVENVQRGIQSRYYTTGRFSPTQERGVHHFHRLIARFLSA